MVVWAVCIITSSFSTVWLKRSCTQAALIIAAVVVAAVVIAKNNNSAPAGPTSAAERPKRGVRGTIVGLFGGVDVMNDPVKKSHQSITARSPGM
jgi:hypothetical protein